MIVAGPERPNSRRTLCYREITAFMRRAGLAGARQGPFFRLGRRRRATEIRMSQQPESISTSFAASPAPSSEPADEPLDQMSGEQQPAEESRRIPRWLERLELVLRVMLRMYIGLAICYAPWSPMFWDQNPLFLQYPTLNSIAASGAVRGLVSGLGLLNLWIAFQDAIQHREP